MRFKSFLKILYSRKERKELIGYFGFSCLFGTGSKFLTVAKIHWLGPVLKDPKIHNFLRDPSGLHALSFWDTTDSEPLWLSAKWLSNTNMPLEVSLPPWDELMGLSRPLLRRKKEVGRQRPLQPLILIPEPSSSPKYMLPGAVPIFPSVITKAPGGSWSPASQNYHGPMGSSFPWP